MESKKSLAGILIFVMIFSSIFYGVLPNTLPFNPMWIGGVAGWIAAILLLGEAKKILKIQVGILLIVGVLLIIYSSSQGYSVSLLDTATSNTLLLSMIASVGFLRLVALPATKQLDDLPKGPKAYFYTLLGVSTFSSFINISAPILISDRIHQQSPLNKLTAQSIIRVFCAAASWSPFFAAMAVILTYLPGAKLQWIILAGFPFAMMSLAVVVIEGFTRYRKQLDSFVGYPMQISSLTVPLLLVTCVVFATLVVPHLPTLVVISLSAIGVTFTLLASRQGFKSSLSGIRDFITQGLPSIVNELLLFLAAGVLAVGITSIVQNGMITNPFTVFDSTIALKLLGVMIVVSAIGIHPVIQIASLSPLLLPLNPDPNLLAVTYLFAWHLGTCSSPLSGTNLVFQGRFGIPSWKAAIWNWPYALVMYGIAIIWVSYISKFFPLVRTTL